MIDMEIRIKVLYIILKGRFLEGLEREDGQIQLLFCLTYSSCSLGKGYSGG
jgi:hypothetical protein